MVNVDRKLPLKALNTLAIFMGMVEAVSNGARLLFLMKMLDHEAEAIIRAQLRSLLGVVDDGHPERGWALMRSAIDQLVPLSNRVAKELYRIQDDPEIHDVTVYHLRRIQEAGKLLEGEKMVKMRVGS